MPLKSLEAWLGPKAKAFPAPDKPEAKPYQASGDFQKPFGSRAQAGPSLSKGLGAVQEPFGSRALTGPFLTEGHGGVQEPFGNRGLVGPFLSKGLGGLPGAFRP